MTTPGLTLLVPCFNERTRIAAALRTLTTWFPDRTEILVIDDGSTDDTFDIVTSVSLENPAVRVYRHVPNRGKGAAIRAAIPLVRSEMVVLIDADVVFDRRSVEGAVLALREADAVIGNRRHDESRYSVPVRLFGFLYRRHLVGLAFNAFVRALVWFPFRDTQCGLKAFRLKALRDIAASLTIDGFAADVEMLLVARALGLRIAQVPVQVTYYTARSSVRILQSGATMSIDLFRIAVGRLAGRYSQRRVRQAASTAAPPEPPRAPREPGQ